MAQYKSWIREKIREFETNWRLVTLPVSLRSQAQIIKTIKHYNAVKSKNRALKARTIIFPRKSRKIRVCQSERILFFSNNFAKITAGTLVRHSRYIVPVTG